MRTMLSFALAVPLVAQMVVSDAKKRAISDHFASEMRRNARSYDHPAVAPYVQSLAAALLSRASVEATVEVIATDRFREPVAVPPRHLFVPVSFLTAVSDEDELAAMLAHTIAHLKDEPVQASPGAISIMAIKHTENMVPMVLLEKQRNDELEADQFAIELASRAGFDASALRRYVERTHPDNPARYAPVPGKAERLSRIDRRLGSLPPRANSEFDQMKQALAAEQPVKRPPSLRRSSR